MTVDGSTRARALELLRQGKITHAEAANYLGISRQSVRMLCIRAGIDAVMARQHYLQRLFHEAEIKQGRRR